MKHSWQRLRRSAYFTSRLSTLLTMFLFLASVTAILILVRAWRSEAAAPVTCGVGFSPLSDHDGYFEIQLKNQHVVEPLFEGKFVVYLTKAEYVQEPMTSLQVAWSGGSSYGVSIATVPLIQEKDMHPTDIRSHLTDFSLVTRGSTHRSFPFDDAKFDFSLKFTPRVSPHVVRITNRVPGFVTACKNLTARKEADGQFVVSFSLERSPLVKLAAVILCFAGTVFLILIPMLESDERVATAVASYFFTLWSIRNILSSQMRVFPTLLDCYILTLCICMVCILIWRVHGRWAKRTAESRLYLPK